MTLKSKFGYIINITGPFKFKLLKKAPTAIVILGVNDVWKPGTVLRHETSIHTLNIPTGQV